MAKNEAVILPVKCTREHVTFYARYDFAFDGVWVLTYGLKNIPMGASIGKGCISKISLYNSRTGPQYKCPYCGNTEFVRCGRCGKLTCYSGEGEFVCDHCSNVGGVNGSIDSIEGERQMSQS